MSEVAKPVEEPVVAPTAATEPAVDSTPAPVAETVEPTTETPAAATTEDTPAVEEAAVVKEEAKPIEEGVLGYKGPGLLKSFIFQKKFFWFGTEPVDTKALSSYLRGEKAQETANKNAAWASHTGAGLLFFSKKSSDKASPAGIFNLSEITDLAEDGTVDFGFIQGGHKHTFQASSLGERDSWVATLKTKIAEAEELAKTVVETETYKKSHSELTKPAVVAAAIPKKSTEAKEEKTEAKEEKKEAKEEKKVDRKSRSASRKRNSIFGGFGKKTPAAEPEAPKEEAPVAAAPAVEEPVVAAPVEPVVPETTTETSTVEATPASPTETKPAASKRSSIFGTLKSQFSSTKEKKTEEAPAVPAKDAEPVSETAPVIPAVEASEPLDTTAPVAETTEAPVVNGETKTPETPVVKTDKRKSSLPWLNKKEKPATTSDEEVEKPKSPFAKLRATVKGKSSPKAEKVNEKTETPATETSAAAEETPASTEAPVVSEPAPVVPASTPQVAASA